MTLHAYLLALALALPGPRDDAYREWLVTEIAREPVTPDEAVDLLAQSFLESPLRSPLPSGCWPGCSCDGGLAHGPWQLHYPYTSPLYVLRTAPFAWTTRARAARLAERLRRAHPYVPEPEPAFPAAPLEERPTSGPAHAPLANPG